MFCRSGGWLADLYAGTFRIEDITSLTGAPVVKVVTTAIAPAHKLGTGRYVLPTGSTSTWTSGTHRAVCEYTMVNGGPTYTQVIEFEVLDSTDWPTGASFITYLTTRRAYQDSYVGTSVTVATLHRLIDEISKKIERWTGRFFDPRYLKYVTEGKASARLLLPEAIVAIEDMYAIWRTSSGNDSYKYEQYLYKVYNRHLDGYSIEDDRHNPRIDLTDVDGNVVEVSDFCWPYGSQNIEVRGVFGFTDVDADYTGGQISVGHTPRDIARVVGSLAYRYTQDPTLSNPTVFSAGNIVSMRTRDQSVTFGGSSSSSSSGAGSSASDMTGDPTLDRILSRFCAPIALGAV